MKPGFVAWKLPWVILFTLFPAVYAQADLRGIYIYTNDVSQVNAATAAQLTQSFSLPGVDGVAVVIGWDALEPSMGQYQWTVLDQWIGAVISLGKKIDLVVPGGGSGVDPLIAGTSFFKGGCAAVAASSQSRMAVTTKLIRRAMRIPSSATSDRRPRNCSA